jgi:acetoacetyl-CoA synthetase
MTPLWTPSQERIEASNLFSFMGAISKRLGRPVETYQQLHAWSVENMTEFWKFYAQYAGLELSSSTVMSEDPMPYTKWFEGATLNYAKQVLYPKQLQSDEQLAVISVTETGYKTTLTFAELRQQVARCAAALQREGIGTGDRVAAFACNVPETLVVFLACASIGAIFSSCSPDFGFEAAYARFGQIEPKLLFASSQYCYGGKCFEVDDTVKKLFSSVLGLQKIIWLPEFARRTLVMATGSEKGSRSFMSQLWDEWLYPEVLMQGPGETFNSSTNNKQDFQPFAFDHPLYILYSSGTTGLPKAIVHRTGGALLQHHKEHHLHCDIKPGDKVLYFSTCGWMMWNWLVSALAQAATIVLYEGSPAYPSADTLWKLAEKYELTFFGTSARYLHSLQAANFSARDLDLSKVRTIASTGSPLSPSAFEYVYKNLKEDVHLASISGGTDIVSCFMLGVPTLPVYTGQIQSAGLAVDLAAFDEDGKVVKGRAGELVCRQPLPTMPLMFWNDPNFQKYRAAYFEVYPNVWRHGDVIEFTEQDGIIVYGRSDATLNPGGVRIGTAEIYRPLEEVTDILESCAVGKKENDDEVIWLFVVLKNDLRLTEDLIKQMKTVIRSKASPRHVPKRIFQVSQLPRTRSGKSMEITVSRLINRQEIPNREVIANPEALGEIQKLIQKA